MSTKTTDPLAKKKEDEGKEEDEQTHKLSTLIHSATPLTLILSTGEASALADRGALLMRLGLIDNMTITRLSGNNPSASDQLTTWLNMAVLQFQQLNNT